MERPARRPEIEPEALSGFIRTFLNRFNVYPKQRGDGRYLSIKQPLSSDLVQQHLYGALTLGAYALDAQSRARWICFDADTPEQWQHLWQTLPTLSHLGLMPYLEGSRRGGHLWLFFQPISGATARMFGQQLAREHGVPLKSPGAEGIELYPKQDKLLDGPGSLVRLPLGIHQKTGLRYSFVNLDGEPLAATIREQLELLAHPTLVSEAVIDAYVWRALSVAESPRPVVALKNTTPVSGERVSERIKNAVSVYDFVSQYVHLDEHGVGKCPFHDDQVKSFGVNREKNYWSCFAACGEPAGGSVIDFWMRWRAYHGQGGSFTETVKELAAMLLPPL